MGRAMVGTTWLEHHFRPSWHRFAEAGARGANFSFQLFSKRVLCFAIHVGGPPASSKKSRPFELYSSSFRWPRLAEAGARIDGRRDARVQFLALQAWSSSESHTRPLQSLIVGLRHGSLCSVFA